MDNWHDAPELKRIPIITDEVEFMLLADGSECVAERYTLERFKRCGIDLDRVTIRILPPLEM